MSVILSLKTEEAVAPFLDELWSAGFRQIEQIVGLPRFITVHDANFETFPFRNHSSVDTCSDGDNKATPCLTPITLPADGMAPWTPARGIRRKNPWKDASPWPRVSSYDPKRTGAGVDVYIIDSGVEGNHPEFGGRMSRPWAINSSVAATRDDSGHGTHCMALAIGRTCGIARDARGYDFKFHNSNTGAGGSATLSALGRCLALYTQTAWDDRPAVLTFSWSGFSSTINAAVSALIDAGIVCCFPAGNEAVDLGTVNVFPAESDPDTIVVGGADMGDSAYMTGWTNNGTNWGDRVDILAPAQRTYSARRASDGGGYRLGNGTSYSTPQVAGIVACMLQGYRRLTTRAQVQAVKARLLANASPGYVPTRRWDGVQMLLPDRIAYFDPRIEFEVIPGLIPKSN